MLRQACVRSLSCEVCPGREGPIFFGEEANQVGIDLDLVLRERGRLEGENRSWEGKGDLLGKECCAD